MLGSIPHSVQDMITLSFRSQRLTEAAEVVKLLEPFELDESLVDVDDDGL